MASMLKICMKNPAVMPPGDNKPPAHYHYGMIDPDFSPPTVPVAPPTSAFLASAGSGRSSEGTE